jgi:antitoxin FitA
MSDLLIRNLSSALRREIQARARKNHHSLSEEAKSLIQQGLAAPGAAVGLGTYLFSSVRDEDRGDDLVFEVPDAGDDPPDFE